MKNKFAENLAEEFEKELTNFLSLSWIEKLEKAEEFFQNSWNTGSYDKSKKITLAFRELTNSYKEDYENSSEEYKEFSEFIKNQNLASYFKRQFYDLAYRLPYYFFFSHIICDRTYSQMDYETKNKLREICELKNPKDRRDTFINFFSFLIREPTIQGGSEGFWNKANSLYFISWYNRFQIVIKNARKDLAKDKDSTDNRQKILEFYEIPKEYEDVVFNKNINSAEISLDWALECIGWKGKDAAKALRKAKNEAGKEAKKNSRKLICVCDLDFNRVITSITLKPEMRSELRFRDFGLNESSTLYYI